MKDRGFLKNATTVAAGSLLAKLIGALYRVALLSSIGGRGTGLYQLVYPFYCLLLTISATGIPSAIAKLGAERYFGGYSDAGVLKTSARLFLTIGGIGSAVMLLLAPVLSALQGERGITGGYVFLAPSVFLVSGISVLRGFFQGRGRMFPTALSEVLEQAVKVGFGLLFAYLYRGDTEKTVRLLLFAVTLSEGATLLFLLVLKRRERRSFSILLPADSLRAKDVLNLSVPVTLSSALAPIVSLAESVLLVRLTGRYSPAALTLYGLYSGGAITLVNLPVSVCHGIAAASVPSVASAKGAAVKRKISHALVLTLFVSAICSFGLFCFAPFAVKTVFRALSEEEKSVLIRLTRICSPSVVFQSCSQTLSACLTGRGKPKKAVVSASACAVIRLFFDCLLVSRPKFSVYGAAIAVNLGYSVAFFLNLMYNLKDIDSGRRTNDLDCGTRNEGRGFNPRGTGGDSLGKAGVGADGEYPLVQKRDGTVRRARNARSRV